MPDGAVMAGPAGLSPLHTALRCLFMLALYRGVQMRPEHFAHVEAGDVAGSALRVLREAGLRGRLLRRGRWRQLTALRRVFPVMGEMRDGSWVVVVKETRTAAGAAVYVLDPRAERAGVVAMPRAAFLRQWSGVLLACRAGPVVEAGRFGLGWFVPEVWRQRGLLRDVAVAALMSSAIGFAGPLLFQALIDKVITHRSTETLATVMVLFGVLALFDGLFGYMRQYLMTVVTGKVDAGLASRVFGHLLGLPLPFFEATTAGVLARNLQQTDTVRQFLTGRVLQTVLDGLSLPLMVGVLLCYSVKLTGVVLGVALLMAGVAGVLVPLFRRQLERLYAAEGARQGHLVETIHGVRTVKSLALEPARQAEWDRLVTEGVRRRAAVGRMGALAGVLTQGLEKAMQMGVLGLGALEVFDGGMSLGALVAFNMVSGRVTGPLVQVVGLVNEWQETRLAVRLLGSVLGQPGERTEGVRPEITGALAFEGVGFRYAGAGAAALDGVSFQVAPGQVVGVVGRSGSGKTTVTRLIQGIQTAQEGVVRLDGVDVRQIELAHLRRSVGVVLQENVLFRGSVRDNIAAARPGAGVEAVREAARLAGADEFIERLPLGYETRVEENGANFSGGQRQRIAIARALMTQPRLLVFDEATSALDPESEAVIQDNLAEIARGRTLVIVSHRLTSLAGADAILVLERGRAVDFAPHRVLLGRCPAYERLWRQQTKHVT